MSFQDIDDVLFPENDAYDPSAVDSVIAELNVAGSVTDYFDVEKTKNQSVQACVETLSVGSDACTNIRGHTLVDQVMSWAHQGKEVLRKNLKRVLAFHGVVLQDPPTKKIVAKPVVASSCFPVRTSGRPGGIPSSKPTRHGSVPGTAAASCSESEESRADQGAGADQGARVAGAAVSDFVEAFTQSVSVAPQEKAAEPDSMETSSVASVSTVPKERMAAVVRIQSDPELDARALRLAATHSNDAAAPTTGSNKDRSKFVDAARNHGFVVQNRCNNEANPLTFCPYCRQWGTNANHFDNHSDMIDVKRIKDYVKGVFSAGLRGPLYRHAVVDQIRKWARDGTLFDNIEKIFAVVGVGITDSRMAAMPLYNLDEVFKPDSVPALSQMHQVLLEADEEIDVE